MNGYVCFFGDKSIEVHADDLYDAKQKAVKLFKVSKKNEYKVSALMPRLAQAVVISRTVLLPALCPNSRIKPRALAQRPLPSIMMAMCFGRIGCDCELSMEVVVCAMG